MILQIISFFFWYRFVFANKSFYELLGDDEAAIEITDNLSRYMGQVFEKICVEYLIRLTKQKILSEKTSHYAWFEIQ